MGQAKDFISLFFLLVTGKTVAEAQSQIGGPKKNHPKVVSLFFVF
jgi:hypothetical protein